MVMVNFSGNIISTYHSTMGEAITFERVVFTNTTIRLYVRNIGFSSITLSSATVNGKPYNFTESNLNLPMAVDGSWFTIQGYEQSPNQTYKIELISNRQRIFTVGMKYS